MKKNIIILWLYRFSKLPGIGAPLRIAAAWVKRLRLWNMARDPARRAHNQAQMETLARFEAALNAHASAPTMAKAD